DTGAAEVGDPAERPRRRPARVQAARVGGLLGKVGQYHADPLDQVDAGREGRPFPGHDQAPEGLVGHQLGAEPGHPLPHQRILRVAFAGTGQGQGADVALALVANGLVVAHVTLLRLGGDKLHPYSTVWMKRGSRGGRDRRWPPPPAYLAARGSNRASRSWPPAAGPRPGSSSSPRSA